MEGFWTHEQTDMFEHNAGNSLSITVVVCTSKPAGAVTTGLDEW